MFKNNKQNSSRKEKIQLLQALKEGRIKPDGLGESIEFLAMQGLDLDGKYSISEQRPNPRPTKYLTPEEFEEWLKEMEQINSTRKNPHRIIIVQWVEQKTNERPGNGLQTNE